MKTTFRSTLKGITAVCLLAVSFTSVHAAEAEQSGVKPDAIYSFTYSTQSYQGSLDHEVEMAQYSIMNGVRSATKTAARNQLSLLGERLAQDARLADTAGGEVSNVAPWRANTLRTFL